MLSKITKTRRRLGEREEVAEFDDSEFYQQMLREIIERRAGGGASPHQVASEVDRLQRALKRRKGPRASKGRTVSFEPIAKLLNFTAAVEESATRLSDHAKNELFASLFGKKKN